MRVYSEEFVKELKKAIEVLEREPTVDFVRGFFDAGGTLCWEGRYIIIEFDNKGLDLLTAVGNILTKLSINHYIKHREWLDKRRNKQYEKYMLIVKREYMRCM